MNDAARTLATRSLAAPDARSTPTGASAVPGRPQRERGAALLFSLLALVALTLAAVALVRTVDTGTLVIGNLGFKLDATSATERAAEQAIAWLNARQTGEALDQNLENDGYYASSLDTLDATGQGAGADRVVVDWNGDTCRSAVGQYSTCLQPSGEIVQAGLDNRSRYVITRMCLTVGSRTDQDNRCIKPDLGAAGADRNRDAPKVGSGRFDMTANNPYYRIVVRTQGARQTVSLTETIVHF